MRDGVTVGDVGIPRCAAAGTVKGPTERMSEHATANAVDISGFRMKLGKKVNLLKNWDGTPQEQEFLRRIRDGGCKFFRITLSPDYNSLHDPHQRIASRVEKTCVCDPRGDDE